jgi:hypothetical protein
MTTPAGSTPLIDSELSHYVIFGCSIFAILWGGLNALWVSQVELDAENIRPNTSEEDKEDPDFEDMPWDAEGCKQRMLEVNEFVKDVSCIIFHARSVFTRRAFCDNQTWLSEFKTNIYYFRAQSHS